MKSPCLPKYPLVRPLFVRLALLVLLAVVGITTVAAAPAAPDSASPPYLFTIDTDIYRAGGQALAVIRNAELEENEALSLSGWVATDAGIASYQYRWHAANGAALDEWRPVEDAVIGRRDDLIKAGVPYESGHSTAGFTVTIPPPNGATAGYYNIYLRAIDKNGAPCDLLAFVRLCYGNADRSDAEGLSISLARLAAEGDGILRGGATATAEGITLPPGGSIRLGEYAMTNYDQVLITYTTEGASDADGRRAVLGLKSTGDHPFGIGGEKYNLTGSIAYAALADKPGTLLIDLSSCDYAGEVWLSAYTDKPLTVTAVDLVYTGYGTDRVAAKIHLSADLLPDLFSGVNCMNLAGITDPALGDVLRMEVSTDTNDPYAYFHAENLMNQADVCLDAGVYRYMVVLARAKSGNAGNHAAFYLCAGSITAPTGSLTCSFTTKNDGQWHYYLLDLGENSLWDGVIHGWRFDIINGNCRAGDTVDFASVQFFRTLEAAEAAAARSPSEGPAFLLGSPAVEKDLCEEVEATPYVIDPADAFVIAESESEVPPVETESETPPAPDSDSVGSDTPVTEPAPAETSQKPEVPSDEGCGSRVSLSLFVLLSVSALSLVRRRRRNA